MSPTNRSRSDEESEILDGLSHLGLTVYESKVYLAVLRRPHSPVTEIAEHSGVPQSKIYATLKRLLERGLCESVLGPVNRYAALSPREAFRPLVKDLREREQAARAAVERLREEHRASRAKGGGRDGRIRLYQGRQAAARDYKTLLAEAESTVHVLARDPRVVADDLDLIAACCERGVQVRQIHELPDGPTSADIRRMRANREAGAAVRWTTSVPMRLFIFDGRVTGLPMVDLQKGRGDGFLLLEIRNESLSAGFVRIHDLIWSQAGEI